MLIINNIEINAEWFEKTTLMDASDLFLEVVGQMERATEEYVSFLSRFAEEQASTEEINLFIGDGKWQVAEKLTRVCKLQAQCISLTTMLGFIEERDRAREEYCKKIGIEPKLIFSTF